MPLLPVAILAQVLTAGVGDRVEVRSVIQADDRRLEGENLAYATVALNVPALTLRATYSPSMLLSPLENKPRDFSVTHTLSGDANSRLTFYESARHEAAFDLNANFTQQDFRRQLIGATIVTTRTDETTPQSTSSLADAARANGTTTRTAGAGGGVTVSHRLSRPSTLQESASYIVSTGLDSDSRALYPLTHGPEANVSFVHAASRRDTLTTTAGAQLLMVPSTDERAFRVGVGEGLDHVFSRRATGNAVLGVAYTRTEEPGAEPIENFSPIARLGLRYKAPLAGGQLSLGVELSYEPVLDRSALVFDTRVGVLGNADWVKDKLTLYAATSTAVSVSPDDPGSLSSASANAGADYDIGAGFVAHVGARAAWQTFENTQELPPTWVSFLALSWNLEWPPR